MLSGNIEGGSIGICGMIMVNFFSGTVLRRVDEDCRNYIPLMEDLKLTAFALGTRLFWQAVLNLIGGVSNPHTTAIQGAATAGTVLDEKNVNMHPFYGKQAQGTVMCHLCAYFSEYKEGAELALSTSDVYDTWSGGAYYGFGTFPRGLCLYAMAHETSQSKYAKAACKARARIQDWVKKGGINFTHQLFILDAEDAVLRGDKVKAKEMYGKAIVSAARGGFLHNAGLANERFSMHLLDLGDTNDARYYMKEAVKHYSEWGALRKVELLKGKYDFLVQ